MLYSEKDVPSSLDKMTLFDAKNKIKKKIDFPKEVFGESQICNRIHLINTTEKAFTIEYEFNNYQQTKQKKYSR